MTKADLISAVAQKLEITKKDAEQATVAVFDTITEALSRDEKVQIVGFGTFEVKLRVERKGKNPSTGEMMIIPSSNLASFRSGKTLKDAIKDVKK